MTQKYFSLNFFLALLPPSCRYARQRQTNSFHAVCVQIGTNNIEIFDINRRNKRGGKYKMKMKDSFQKIIHINGKVYWPDIHKIYRKS